MNKSNLCLALSALLLTAPLAAQQQPTLQLPPPTPAKAPTLTQPAASSAAAASASPVPASPPALSAASAPVLPSPSPALQAPIARAPAPAPAAAAPAGGVVATVAAAPKAKPVARRAAAHKPAAKAAEPFADLPINEPAREALRRSAEWTGNNSAVVAGGSDGRVVFTFGETMPTVVCAPLRMCEIELQPGEKVSEQPHIGDDVRWNISPGITGSGQERITHVIVKPSEAGLDTNLLIPTDRRMYRLRLVSSEQNYVSVVSFSYPQDDKQAWDMAIAKQEVEEGKVVADLPSMSVDALDFDFGVTVAKGKPKWKPTRVFSDGTRTYIQLPEGTTQQDAPAVVALGADGTEQLVNFRFRGGYVMVDRVIERAALISGLDGEAQRVEIQHGCAKRTIFGNCKG